MATIKNIKEFLEEIENLESNNNLFFRGHEDETYLLEPGIYRKDNTTKKSLIENEDLIYREVISKAPQDFVGKNTLESLALMQHYGVPTRILDLTESALVALYFACFYSKNDDKNGEVIVFDIPTESVKYYNSDRVTILANLAKCEKDLQFNCGMMPFFIEKKEILESKKESFSLLENVTGTFNEEIFDFFYKKSEDISNKIAQNNFEFSEFDSDLEKLKNEFQTEYYKFINHDEKVFTNTYIDTLINILQISINKSQQSVNNSYFGKLLHNIREDKSYFDAIINPYDISNVFAIKPKLDNPRIVRQHGAFLIFGIKETHFVGFGDYKPMAELNTDWILRGKPHKERIIIDKDSKDKIRKELNTLGYNQSTLFPEIDKVAEYVRDKYK